jgi:Uma2 family endonuclease
MGELWRGGGIFLSEAHAGSTLANSSPCFHSLPMRSLKELEPITVEDYLAGEQASNVRREFIGGAVYAMAGASEEHNTISLSIASALRAHLRGKPCRVFIADLKVRLQIARTDIFYYPDVMVTCDPHDQDRYFKRHPKVLIEVLSESTDHIDRREKFLSYTQIESLEEYVLVAQDQMEVTVFRRAKNWHPEVLRQPDQPLCLASLDFSLPLRDVYEGVKV